MPASRLVRRTVAVGVLGAAVSVALVLAPSLRATLDAFRGFRWALAPVVVAAVLVNYALRFLKWDYYLRRLSIPLPRRQSALVFLAGFAMAITPGKLGELLKAVLVRDLVGTEIGRTASVVMAERLTDVAGLVILSAFGATVLPGGGIVLGVIAGGLAVAVVAIMRPELAGALQTRLASWPAVGRLAGTLAVFLAGGRSLLAPGPLAWAVALSTVSWFSECLALSLVLGGLGAPVPLRAATFVYAFASLAGAVSMLPGGLGAAEASLAALLVALGIGLPQAAAATLLIRAVTLWLAVGLGAATLLLAFRGGPARAERARS